ncbi:hypothetical protein RJ640_025928 [Escallonia rubra]|uniref:Splicing factor Cactin n=1 Tax=Escallonia rubra TaxID=112253 RepID=A0AA88UKQ0_9ASTE|nr:hypothetical protein RJ640_025928 [Escallonia rubra]
MSKVSCSGNPREGRSRKITIDEIAKYLSRKAEKKARKVARKLKSQPVSGNVNLNNDTLFVWRKKIKRDVELGLPIMERYSVKHEKKSLRESVAELEKLKKRREERAVRKAQREEEMAFLTRGRAGTEYEDWERKEEEFVLKQSKIKSEIRLQKGHAKPIDKLINLVEGSTDVFKGLKVEELEELLEEINLHREVTQMPVQFWEALQVVCTWELALTQKKLVGDQERSLHSSVVTVVENFLERKSYKELEELNSQIESKMRSGQAQVVEFWEDVARRLEFWIAKACLNEIYANMSCTRQPSGSEDNLHNDHTLDQIDETLDHGTANDADSLYPEPIPQVDGCLEKVFPRKPKFLTRVQSRYVRNKYNQTHYDHDNPPPKMIQGYKFEIYYPDLIDMARAPSYVLENDGDSKDTCIIRFHSGPPYEDVAFRIVNDEWEMSRKKGFKCTHESGVLHLHFTLKRYRYRR